MSHLWRGRSLLALVACLALPRGSALAQCADGSPPPCRAAARNVTARPTGLPLDDRTWIVLPFENQARAADLDWLRDASVNLLYMDLSRWSDVHAIDDKRVADYLRTLPAARSSARLTLGDGQDLARLAGAGKLVMGEFLKIGNLTRVSATAYDVRSGSRIRTVTEQTPVADSLMSVFGKLARGLLDVSPPAGASVGTPGTSSVGALQEYLLGVKALNRFDLAGARPHFDRALQLDSTFALAHYKYAIMIGWEAPGNPGIRAHSEAAQRFSASLPQRERALIAGHLAFTSQDYVRARERYDALVSADSNDVEALYGLADCVYHDQDVLPMPGDTTRFVFRGDWNKSIRLFQRVLTLDPSFHLAFAHILDALTSDARSGGCRRPAPGAPCTEMFQSALRRNGDTLVLEPVSVRLGATFSAHAEEARRKYAKVRNLEQARAAAAEWVAGDPGERRARTSLAHVELLLGHVGRADTLLAGIGDGGSVNERVGVARDRAEIALRLGQVARSLRTIDSAFATLPPSNGNRLSFGVFFLMAGRPAMYDSTFDGLLRAQGGPASVVAYYHEARRVVIGIGGDSAVAAERRLVESLSASTACRGDCMTRNLLPSLVFGLRLPRVSFPAFDTTHADWRLGPARALLRGDTAALRGAARRLDSLVAADAAAGAAEDGVSITLADAWLALRDSVSALDAVRRMLDVTAQRGSITSLAGTNAVFVAFTWPRAMLLRADLAAALGKTDEARTWYKRWLNLWSRAEPEFQPLVDRVRKSYATLGGT